MFHTSTWFALVGVSTTLHLNMSSNDVILFKKETSWTLLTSPLASRLSHILYVRLTRHFICNALINVGQQRRSYVLSTRDGLKFWTFLDVIQRLAYLFGPDVEIKPKLHDEVNFFN